MRLLIAEDEPDLLAALAKMLRAQGYAVDEAMDGEEALFKAKSYDYDAIVLDLMLPQIEGFEVLRQLRIKKKTPVLILTARERVDDRIRGLDFGADDYVIKPVDIHELAARLRALIRRTTGNASSEIAIADVIIDVAGRRVTKSGEPIPLSGREFSILEFLSSRRGKIVTRGDLFEHLHDEADTPISNLVDVHIFYLRKKLGADFIVTHRGQGYSVPA